MRISKKKKKKLNEINRNKKKNEKERKKKVSTICHYPYVDDDNDVFILAFLKQKAVFLKGNNEGKYFFFFVFVSEK